MPEAADQLTAILRQLEVHYKDMQDTEFTVEEGALYMLQTRSAKRPAQAAVRFAVDAFEEGLLTKAEAIATIDAGALDALLHPSSRRQPRYTRAPRGRRLARRRQGCDRLHRAGGGRAGGRRQGGDPRAAVHRGRRRGGVSRRQRDPHLRGRQGVARGAGRARDGPARGHRRGRPGRRPARRRGPGGRARPARGDFIAIDGSTGTITTDDVPLVEAHVDARFETVLALVRRAAATRRARQRRHPGGRRPARTASAPRGSGCAGPSTCSWPQSVSRRCAR